MRKCWIGLAFSLFIAAGCQTLPPNIPPISPPPVTQVVRVRLSPEVGQAAVALQACSDALPGISLLLIEIAPGQTQVLSGDILIHLGYAPDPELFHIPLAIENFSFIANAAFPMTTMPIEDLRAAYRGEVQTWEDLNLITASPPSGPVFWTYPESHPLIKAVFQPVLNLPPNLPPRLNLAPDSAAMQQAVLETEGSLGFIPDAWKTPEVKVITIVGEGGRLPTVPVLATTAEPPGGAIKSFLTCLQGSTGQNILNQFYKPWSEN